MYRTKEKKVKVKKKETSASPKTSEAFYSKLQRKKKQKDLVYVYWLAVVIGHVQRSMV